VQNIFLQDHANIPMDDEPVINNLVGLLSFMVNRSYIETKISISLMIDLREGRRGKSSQVDFSASALIDSQRELLPRLYQSHRLFVINFFASFLMIPLWFLWVVFFAAAIAESFEWFLLITASIWIALPFTVFSFWSRWKVFIVYMRSAKDFLDDAKKDINASKTAEDFTTYMNLLFPVLLPMKSPTTDTMDEQQRIRKVIRNLRIQPVVEVVVLAAVIFSFGSFFIRRPYVLSWLLPTLLIPFLLFNIGLMIVRLGIFLKWRQLISRWLNLYDTLATWQANLESKIQQSSNKSERKT
jgi:hypothetical protein